MITHIHCNAIELHYFVFIQINELATNDDSHSSNYLKGYKWFD